MLVTASRSTNCHTRSSTKRSQIAQRKSHWQSDLVRVRVRARARARARVRVRVRVRVSR